MSQHYINANFHWGGWPQRARGTTYSPTSRRMCLDWWLYAGCCPIPSISRALEVARRKRPPGVVCVCVHNNISSFRACFYLPKILLGFLRVKCFRGGIFFEFQFQFCMEKLDAGITNQFWKGLKSFHVRSSLFPASEWWYSRYRLVVVPAISIGVSIPSCGFIFVTDTPFMFPLLLYRSKQKRLSIIIVIVVQIAPKIVHLLSKKEQVHLDTRFWFCIGN